MCSEVFPGLVLRCSSITKQIHGSSDPVSTGSHAQYPPQSRIRYAHKPPRPMPRVEKKNAGLATRIKRSLIPRLDVISDVIDMIASVIHSEYARNIRGGWIIIKSVCSSSFKPGPLDSASLNGCNIQATSSSVKANPFIILTRIR